MPRPFEPGRAEPPVPVTDDLEPGVAPPLRGKAHPPAEMDEVIPSLDDEVSRYHRPRDQSSSVFGFDPDAADAAADLAGDLGSTFLNAATRGEDMSDVTMSADDRDEDSLPFVIEEQQESPSDRALPPRRVRRSVPRSPRASQPGRPRRRSG